MNSESPYNAPSSDVLDPGSTSSLLLDLPMKHPAGQGVAWLREGFGVFKAAPGLWIGMLIVYIIIMMLLGFVPVLGNLATIVLGPVFTGGFMLVSRNMESGTAAFNDMFAGFRDKFGPLVVLGLIYFGLFIIPMAIFMAVGMGSMMSMDPTSMESPEALGLPFLLGFLIFIALMIPLAMGMWFAPCLIMFNDLSPWNAFITSFRGCLSNILPFLLYGIVVLLLAIIAMIPIGLGFLILGPTIIGSIYKSYQQIFLR